MLPRFNFASSDTSPQAKYARAVRAQEWLIRLNNVMAGWLKTPLTQAQYDRLPAKVRARIPRLDVNGNPRRLSMREFEVFRQRFWWPALRAANRAVGLLQPQVNLIPPDEESAAFAQALALKRQYRLDTSKQIDEGNFPDAS